MGHNDRLLTEDFFLRVAIEAGALKCCPSHPEVFIHQGDPDAEKRTYAIATNRWKHGDFIEDRTDVMEGIKMILDAAADECPECEGLRNS